MKIVVTGAGGFIGRHMANFLEEKGNEVKRLDNPYVDLRNYNTALAAVEGADQVYHFAAHIGGVGYLTKHQYEPFVDNMTMDLNILKACEAAGVKRLFYAASVCAYPTTNQMVAGEAPNLTEGDFIPAEADQMYGWEKLMMILLARHAPLDVRVGVFNTIFGEYQEWEGEKSKFPPAMAFKVLQAKKTGEPIHIWGDGTQSRTFVYIADAVEKIYEIMDTEEYWGEVNIASDEISTVQQCVDWLCEIAGITPGFVYEMDKPQGVMARGISNAKFEEHYKYRNRFTTRQGLERLYRWIETQV
jgi:GDP-D-mannose 3', 5'-epimerase